MLVMVLGPFPRVSTHLASRAGLKMPASVGTALPGASYVGFVAGAVVRWIVSLDIFEPGPRRAGDVVDGPVVG